MASPNIVPLIDILLVLIIIFMVITPLIPKGLDALIPQPSPAGSQNQQQAISQRTVVVQVLATGHAGANGLAQFILLKINEEDANWNTLGPRISSIFKDRAEKVAFVRGDDSVPFSEVARVIDLMHSSGVDKVGLITANLEAGR